MEKTEHLDTIWEVPDELWAEVEKVLVELDPPSRRGRPRVDARRVLDGIIYRLRSSCQWNHLPKEFGDDSSIHRTFQHWIEKGVSVKVWAVLAGSCDELGGVIWRWQSADGAMGKARQGGTMLAPTPRTGARAGRREASLLMAMAGH